MLKGKPKIYLLLVVFLMARVSSFASSGIKLIENKGQWQKNILYKAFIPGGSYYIENGQLTYFFYDEKTLHLAMHDHLEVDSIRCHVVRVKFKNANPNASALNSLTSYESYNYFIGNEPSKWASNCKAMGKVTIQNLWQGIDLEIIPKDDALKYNFIVHAGANPKNIQLEYEGANQVYTQNEALHIRTNLCHIEEEKPVAKQEEAMNKTAISCSYLLKKNILSFNLSNYDKKSDLIIDPIVIFATYSGSYADNFGFTGTYDHQGNGYSGGEVFSDGFPTTTGAFQVKFQGGFTDINNPNGITEFARDAGILKYSPDGKKLIWATYIGGNQNEEPHSMIVNKAGELVILGTTFSKNFPFTKGAYNTTYSGSGDMFICKLSSDGSALNACTFIGGSDKDGLNGQYEYNPNGADGPLAYNYGDHYRGEVIIDSNDNILIASCTRSSNFPVKNAIQTSLKGNQDACILKLKPDLSGLIWSTYLGGTDEDAAYGINFDLSGNIFVTGGTQSNNFPTTSGAAFQNYFGNIDGFLCKIDQNGKSLLASTYLGTSSYDQSYFVQLDGLNRVYITGQTKGQFPVNGKVYCNNSSGKQFIGVFTNDLSKMSLSTVFGTGRAIPDLSPSAFLVDLCGRICVSGWGGQVNYDYNGEGDPNSMGTYGMQTTSDAFQSNTDGSDFYLIVLGKDLSSLIYASFFGGTRGSLEHVDGGTSRFDRDGKVYQSVCGGCGGYSDFPTTPGAWSATNNGKRPWPLDPKLGGCNNAMFKTDLNSSNYPPTFKDTTLIAFGTDLINYQFDISDFDKKDSIYVSYDGTIFDPKKIKGNTALLQVNNGIGSVNATLEWQTGCEHVSTDTYYVNIHLHDNGCPTQRHHDGVIKIVIQAPPPVKPPGVFCLDRVNNNQLKISWTDVQPNKYLLKYNLVKVFPDASQKIITTFNSNSSNEYIDNYVPNYRTQDYCYFIYGVNKCGIIGDSTRKICSVPDKDSIPPPIYVNTVTVVNNKSIKLVWNQAGRKDFFTYQIFRKINKPTEQFNLYASIVKNQKDTTFNDSNVNVQNTSYCYKVRAVTQCGIEGMDGNIGTSICLKGNASISENQLYWNEYEKWKGGVLNYEIFRQDSTPNFNSLYNASGNTIYYTDDSLNIDYGIYSYKIIAHEGVKGQNAISESNEIQLIQKPIINPPNVFTPNGDGINDGWNPVPAYVKDYHLKIYNRWGSQVWETDNKKEKWNGVFFNDLPFLNVFIWQLDYSGWDKSINFKEGNVTILK